MTSFSSMSSMLWGFVGTWMLLLFFGFVLLETFAILAKQDRMRYVYPLILLLLYSMLQSVIWLTPMEESVESFPVLVSTFVSLPYGVILLLCTLFTALLILSTIHCHTWQKENITNMSVKYAVDTFPEGICCYDDNGMILLKNRAMDHICRLFTGAGMKNGAYFYAALCEGNLLPECQVRVVEDEQLLALVAGKAFSVIREPLEYRGTTLHCMIAADITEEYHKTEELLLRQKQVQRLNEKLKSYNQEILAVITARETLNAKVRIHDELGLGLLSAKRYIMTGGSEEEKQALITSLKQQLRYLHYENDEADVDEYPQLLRVANDLGIQIKLDGSLPDTEQVKHIFITAIHECITNTIRHAHGDTVTVCLREALHAYTGWITNNGETPDGPIVEKGGLAALRKMVSAYGGSMKVSTKESFVLELELPKEGQDEI